MKALHFFTYFHHFSFIYYKFIFIANGFLHDFLNFGKQTIHQFVRRWANQYLILPISIWQVCFGICVISASFPMGQWSAPLVKFCQRTERSWDKCFICEQVFSQCRWEEEGLAVGGLSFIRDWDLNKEMPEWEWGLGLFVVVFFKQPHCGTGWFWKDCFLHSCSFLPNATVDADCSVGFACPSGRVFNADHGDT